MQKKPRIVVKLKTSYWYNKDGFYSKREFKLAKKLCHGYNFIAEEFENINAKGVFDMIQSHNTIEDGLYEIVPIVSFEYDGGMTYEIFEQFKLVPFANEV